MGSLSTGVGLRLVFCAVESGRGCGVGLLSMGVRVLCLCTGVVDFLGVGDLCNGVSRLGVGVLTYDYRGKNAGHNI